MSDLRRILAALAVALVAVVLPLARGACGDDDQAQAKPVTHKDFNASNFNDSTTIDWSRSSVRTTSSTNVVPCANRRHQSTPDHRTRANSLAAAPPANHNPKPTPEIHCTR